MNLRRRAVARTIAAAVALTVVAVVGTVAGASLLATDHTDRAAARPETAPSSAAAPGSSVPGPPTVPVTDAQKTVTSTRTIDVNRMPRTYEIVASTRRASARIPVIVVLHGRSVTPAIEEVRDGLVPLARAGRVVLVYPAGRGQSWNAGTCCGPAHAAGVDDVAFVDALIRSLRNDPSIAASRLALVGYSNGGKLAYDVVCQRPSLVSAVAIVAAVPVVPCPAGAPVSLLQIAGTADAEVAYDGPGGNAVNGFRESTVAAQVATWRARDRCSGMPTVHVTGSLRTETWTACAPGSRVQLATYVGGTHSWPVGSASTPPASSVIWQFLNR